MLTLAFVQIDAGFSYHENFNDLLEVEWMGGDSEMTEEEYEEGCYRRDQLHPETGCRYFRALFRVLGTGTKQIMCGRRQRRHESGRGGASGVARGGVCVWL